MVLWSMTLANAMILVDQTAVPLALPNIIQDFHVGTQQVQWVMNASLLPLAGLLVLGGRPPLVAGFAVLLASGLLLAWGVHGHAYLPVLPGLLLYGTGLALILTVNDPVSIDTVPARDHGQASGVSATAEQFGGAVGIAVLYLIFHATYLNQLQATTAASPLSAMTQQQRQQFKDALATAEAPGCSLNPLAARWRSTCCPPGPPPSTATARPS